VKTRYDVRVGRDSIEVLDLTDGEVVLFWDCPPKARRRMAEALRHDLGRLDDPVFLERWRRADPQQFA
jgi:hypothetical protein